MLQHLRCAAKGSNRPPAWQPKVAVALFLILLANGSPLTHAAKTCDFTLPPLSFFTSLTHTANFPPDALASASSRYLWSCKMSASLNEQSMFKVDAHALVEVSGMLFAAAQQSDVLNIEAVLSDPLSDSPNSEWIVKSEALLSYTSIQELHRRVRDGTGLAFAQVFHARMWLRQASAVHLDPQSGRAGRELRSARRVARGERTRRLRSVLGLLGCRTNVQAAIQPKFVFKL